MDILDPFSFPLSFFIKGGEVYLQLLLISGEFVQVIQVDAILTCFGFSINFTLSVPSFSFSALQSTESWFSQGTLRSIFAKVLFVFALLQIIPTSGRREQIFSPS